MHVRHHGVAYLRHRISNHKAISGDSKKMVGIRNGIDVELWDPLTDTFVPLVRNFPT